MVGCQEAMKSCCDWKLLKYSVKALATRMAVPFTMFCFILCFAKPRHMRYTRGVFINALRKKEGSMKK